MQTQPNERHRIVIPLYDHTTEAEARELAEELERVFGLALPPRVEGYATPPLPRMVDEGGHQ